MHPARVPWSRRDVSLHPVSGACGRRAAPACAVTTPLPSFSASTQHPHHLPLSPPHHPPPTLHHSPALPHSPSTLHSPSLPSSTPPTHTHTVTHYPPRPSPSTSSHHPCTLLMPRTHRIVRLTPVRPSVGASPPGRTRRSVARPTRSSRRGLTSSSEYPPSLPRSEAPQSALCSCPAPTLRLWQQPSTAHPSASRARVLSKQGSLCTRTRPPATGQGGRPPPPQVSLFCACVSLYMLVRLVLEGARARGGRFGGL